MAPSIKDGTELDIVIDDGLREDPALADLISEYEVLRALIPELEHRITRQHEQGPPALEELEAELAQRSLALETLEAELAQLEDEARELRRGADEWMRSYEQLPEAERGPSWPKVEAELGRRNQNLQAKQAKIAQRAQHRLTLLGECGRAREELMAARAGVYDKGIENDPRLKSARQALRRAASELRRAIEKRE